MAGKGAKLKERPVLITTAHRGVFFGYTEKSGEEIAKSQVVSLKRARNCLYWSSDVKGFEGLAVTGPNSKCRVGPPADISLNAVTSCVEVEFEAAKAWEGGPWAS
jgi:hypothetical protein